MDENAKEIHQAQLLPVFVRQSCHTRALQNKTMVWKELLCSRNKCSTYLVRIHLSTGINLLMYVSLTDGQDLPRTVVYAANKIKQ